MPITDTYGTFDREFANIKSQYDIYTPGSGSPEQHFYHDRFYVVRWRIGKRNPLRRINFRFNTEATTKYDATWTRLNYSPLSCTIRFTDITVFPKVKRVWTYQGDVLFKLTDAPVAASDATSDAIAKNKALESFMGKIRGRVTTFQGGVAVGEIRETIGLLANPLNGIRQGLETYLQKLLVMKRRANRSRLSTSKLLKQASETWLEMSFGWKPFFSDVADLAETLGRLKERPPDRESVRGQGEFDRQVSVTTVWTDFAFGAQAIGELHLLEKYIWRFYGSVDCSSSATSTPELDRFGLGLESFLPTVWEVIPYSFVVDYFTNVGKMIEAYSLFNNRIKRVAYARKTRAEQTLKGIRPKNPVPGPTCEDPSMTLVPGAASWWCENYSRDIYSGSLVPDFRWKLPTRLNQYVNLAALLVLRKKVLPFKSSG